MKKKKMTTEHKLIYLLVTHRIIESQNGGDWNGPLENIWFYTPAQAEQQKQVVQNHIQMAFEDLHGQSLQSLSRKPVPMLRHCIVKKCFLMLRQKLLFSSCFLFSHGKHRCRIHRFFPLKNNQT